MSKINLGGVEHDTQELLAHQQFQLFLLDCVLSGLADWREVLEDRIKWMDRNITEPDNPTTQGRN